MVDTGASITIISERVAQNLGINLASIPKVPLVGITQKIYTPIARLSKLVISSGFEKDNISVRVLSSLSLVDGLLGVDFLKDFRVIFEFSKSRIILRKSQSI